MSIKLTTFIGATGAYACIKRPNDDGFVRTLDVLMTRSGSMRHQLAQDAAEMRTNAARILDRAALIDRAIATLVD